MTGTSVVTEVPVFVCRVYVFNGCRIGWESDVPSAVL